LSGGSLQVVYNTKYDVVYNPLRPDVSHNFLSDKEIKKIIDNKNYDWHKGEVVGPNDDHAVADNVRNVEKTQLEDHDYGWLSDKIYRHINQVIKKSDFPDINVTEVSQIDLLRYRGGGKYTWHNDVTYGDSHFQRKFTAIIALNDRDDDYTGGFLKIAGFPSSYRWGDKDYFRKGSILVFPSYMDHIVTPITSGTRYSIVAWGEGPYWR
jgi:predicted 2-oxoglutarate/Fe(II)-dependent dioxygenase YbiX